MTSNTFQLPLLALSLRNVEPLRSEKHANLKNRLMMSILLELPWFVEFRKELKEYRDHKQTKAPKYPSKEVEEIEKEVDKWIVDNVDPDYRR